MQFGLLRLCMLVRYQRAKDIPAIDRRVCFDQDFAHCAVEWALQVCAAVPTGVVCRLISQKTETFIQTKLCLHLEEIFQ